MSLATGQPVRGIFSFSLLIWEVHPIEVGGVTPGQVGLGGIGQAEQATGNKPVINVPRRHLLQFCL